MQLPSLWVNKLVQYLNKGVRVDWMEGGGTFYVLVSVKKGKNVCFTPTHTEA
jgi:hypothetical protein